jgi:hypothetical protein
MILLRKLEGKFFPSHDKEFPEKALHAGGTIPIGNGESQYWGDSLHKGTGSTSTVFISSRTAKYPLELASKIIAAVGMTLVVGVTKSPLTRSVC